MQTFFSPAQLTDPGTADANAQLRACVHCGFCTATCPTYLLLGDELDSPRGRIYLIKEMLEQELEPAPGTILHLDRCLSCLACQTTCGAGVNYMHLLDHARAYIEKKKARPAGERMLRGLLVRVLSDRKLFRLSLYLGRLAKPFAGLLPRRLRAMVQQAPWSLPVAGATASPGVFPAQGKSRSRMALLSGCVQPVLAPGIDEAVVRLLTRHGVEIVIAPDQACCGAMAQHMGDEDQAKARAKANIAAWEKEKLDAIVTSASGCGTVVKNYGFMLREEPEWAARAAKISALTKDISEVLAGLDLKSVLSDAPTVAYHSACSLQHGQKITDGPRDLLTRAGFTVKDIAEGHICCGSAGTYSMLEPELAGRLRERKLANITATGAVLVAAGNIGCIQHLKSGGARMVHTAELLDWATGGPKPAGV